MRRIETVLLMALVLGGATTQGCGGDDPTPPPSNTLTINVRNGTWDLTETFWEAGDATRCDTTRQSTDTTVVLCDTYTPTEGEELLPTYLDCNDITQNGDYISFSCSKVLNLKNPDCDVQIELFGEGTTTETALDLTWGVAFDVLTNEPICKANYGPAEACTLWAKAAGQWISSEGDTSCSNSGIVTAIPLQSLLSRLPVTPWDTTP